MDKITQGRGVNNRENWTCCLSLGGGIKRHSVAGRLKYYFFVAALTCRRNHYWRVGAVFRASENGMSLFWRNNYHGMGLEKRVPVERKKKRLIHAVYSQKELRR